MLADGPSFRTRNSGVTNMVSYPKKLMVRVVHPLQLKLDMLREIERRMVVGTWKNGLQYNRVSNALALLEPIVVGVPIAAKHMGVFS